MFFIVNKESLRKRYLCQNLRYLFSLEVGKIKILFHCVCQVEISFSKKKSKHFFSSKYTKKKIKICMELVNKSNDKNQFAKQ